MNLIGTAVVVVIAIALISIVAVHAYIAFQISVRAFVTEIAEIQRTAGTVRAIGLLVLMPLSWPLVVLGLICMHDGREFDEVSEA